MLVFRKQHAPLKNLVPPEVEYRLTPKGESFIPVIAEIRKWGARHLVGERLRLVSWLRGENETERRRCDTAKRCP
jgi:DNA-binding HxlR family transcriptional regulator